MLRHGDARLSSLSLSPPSRRAVDDGAVPVERAYIGLLPVLVILNGDSNDEGRRTRGDRNAAGPVANHHLDSVHSPDDEPASGHQSLVAKGGPARDDRPH